jgi:myo-inositol 2-dehydrogenase / D-chiro-inositol 1-dehydrogenase
VNVGIVGCGRVTRLRHVPALRRVPEARVVALADVDQARCDALAGENGPVHRYRDHTELLANASVEAVAVCVPASLHADVAVAAIAAGKHVLIEKPLCLRLDEAERILAAASASPATVTVGFNHRWHRLVRRARDAVRSGVLGPLEAIRTTFTSSFDYRDNAQPWRFRRESGGGALLEMAPHHLDLWRFLSDLEVEEVLASSRSDEDEDATVVVTGVLAGGVRASTLVSQRSTNVNELELYGSRGFLRVSCYRYDGFDLQVGRGFGGDLRQRVRGLGRAAAELPAFAREARRGGAYVDSYTAQWRHFVERAAAALPAETGVDDGVANVRVLLAAVESASSGRAVGVADAPLGLGSVTA